MTFLCHPLNPIWNDHSRILLLGTIPSPASRQINFYYGHKRNRFWPLLCHLLGEELPASNEGKRDLLLRRNVALWDVVKSCSIDGASDQSIRNVIANDITPLLNGSDIQAIFTTGTTAWKLYHRLIEPMTGRQALCLPSPSPANCARSFDNLYQAWSVILPWLPDAF